MSPKMHLYRIASTARVITDCCTDDALNFNSTPSSFEWTVAAVSTSILNSIPFECNHRSYIFQQQQTEKTHLGLKINALWHKDTALGNDKNSDGHLDNWNDEVQILRFPESMQPNARGYRFVLYDISIFSHVLWLRCVCHNASVTWIWIRCRPNITLVAFVTDNGLSAGVEWRYGNSTHSNPFVSISIQSCLWSKTVWRYDSIEWLCRGHVLQE